MKIKNIKDFDQRDEEGHLERKATERYLENYKLEREYATIYLVGSITKEKHCYDPEWYYNYNFNIADVDSEGYRLYIPSNRQISVQTGINLSMKNGIKSKCYALKEKGNVVEVKEGNVIDANLFAKNFIINKRRLELENLVSLQKDPERKVEIVDMDNLGDGKWKK